MDDLSLRCRGGQVIIPGGRKWLDALDPQTPAHIEKYVTHDWAEFTLTE